MKIVFNSQSPEVKARLALLVRMVFPNMGKPDRLIPVTEFLEWYCALSRMLCSLSGIIGDMGVTQEQQIAIAHGAAHIAMNENDFLKEA